MALGPPPPDVVVALDNDVLNRWRTREPATLKAINNYVALVKAPPALTAMTVFEMLHGIEKQAFQSGGMTTRLSQYLDDARGLTKECTVLPFDRVAAEIAAYIWPRLSRKEKKDLWADVFIAATALAHEYGIATQNRHDFELIAQHTPPNYPPLRIEIWK
jgi:predicted nucleic acid-binding protein